MAEQLRTFFVEAVTFDEAAVKKHLGAEARPLLEGARALVDTRLADGAPALEAAFREFAEQKGEKLGKLAQPVRVAVTGGTVSPPLFDFLVLLGREKTLQRLDAALHRIGG